jgi:hypothetical protein
LLSISSPKLLDDDLNATMTEILVWAETATTYGLSKTLDAMMKELKKVVNSFPEMITTEILESMRLNQATISSDIRQYFPGIADGAT